MKWIIAFSSLSLSASLHLHSFHFVSLITYFAIISVRLMCLCICSWYLYHLMLKVKRNDFISNTDICSTSAITSVLLSCLALNQKEVILVFYRRVSCRLSKRSELSAGIYFGVLRWFFTNSQSRTLFWTFLMSFAVCFFIVVLFEIVFGYLDCYLLFLSHFECQANI